MVEQVDQVVEENELPLYEKQLDEVFLILVYRYCMSKKE
jgi:hypothetical protein